MPNPLADCGGEGRAGSARRDGNAGCNGCAVNGGVAARCSPGAGGTACGEAGGSGGGGCKAGGSEGLGSTGSGDHGAAPCALPVLCGAGWSGEACGI